MKHIYESISITHFTKSKTTHVHYYKHVDGEEAVSTFDELSPADANRLMWELVKKGGKNQYDLNPYRNTISTRHVTYIGEL